jgi:hypothetical protein
VLFGASSAVSFASAAGYHENEKATADFSVFTNGNYLNRNGAVLQQQIDFTSALPQ